MSEITSIHSSSATSQTQSETVPHQEQHYRLRRAQESDDGEDDPGYQGNEQGATNCDDCLYSPDVIFENGYPVEYSCEELIDTDKDLTFRTTLTFDYEATLPLDQDSEENVQALEWSLLKYAAKRSGLDPKCNFDVQYELEDDEDNFNDRQLLEAAEEESFSHRQRRLEPLSYPLAIYKINRNPSDPSEDDCQVIKYNPSEEQCVSVQSRMEVEFRGQESDAIDVKEFLKSIFEKRMQTKPSSLRAGYVSQLAYVGDKDAISTSSVEPPSAESKAVTFSSSDSGDVFLPVVISASTVVLLGGIFLLFRARHRRSQGDASVSIKEESVDLPDLETGSSETSDDSLGLKSRSLSPSSLGNQPRSLSASDLSVERPPMQPRRSDSELIDPGLRFAASQDSTDGILTTSAVVAGVAPDMLPPRPPRRNSMKLKKRRRRRKKKKKVTLQRVNSRENITEMDTITESEEEEGSEYTYESGSEYSTEDDGSSNQSSGYLTPIRNRSAPNSRASSRHSSPRLSPQDELFPADVFSTDFEFFIEAPDFPYHSKDKKKSMLQPRLSTNKLSKGNKNDAVSPILEEKKIRPLPPPWL